MMMVLVIFILSSLAFSFTASYYVKKKNKVKRRIEQLIPEEETVIVNEKVQKSPKKSPVKELIQTLSKNIKTPEHQKKKLENELESAGIPLKVEEFITIRIVIFGLIFVSALLLGLHFILSILAGFIVWKIPSFYIKKRRDARIAACAGQLSQSLEIMANAMKSGFSFMQSMQLVSKEMPDPIGIEFKKTIKEINLGISMEKAFDNLLIRLPNKDLEIVVTAVLIQRSTGGNLAQILETIQETISERVRMKDELKALTAQGRMSALVITLLPVGLALILNIMNPEYFTPMLSHPLGLVLLGGGIVSGLLGWLFIKKVVTIEV